MGNHLACISIQSCDVVAAKAKQIVVVHSGESQVLEFSGPTIQVAELMLEFPGFFITELKLEQSTQISTSRALPMGADKVLVTFNSKKPAVAYVLLPMSRTQKPVAAQEWDSWATMAVNHLSASVIKKHEGKSRSRRTSNRVAPLQDAQDEIVVEEAEESPKEDIMKQVKEDLSSISSSYNRTRWAPKLQTITEV